jgi:hypothetical protein
MKFITVLFVFFGIWLVASFTNGVLSGICLFIINNDDFGNEVIGLAILFSFVFSLPLVGIVWLVTTVAQITGTKGFALFKTAAITTSICAIAGAVFFAAAFSHDFKEAAYAVGACIIFSAILSVTIFRKQLKGHD